MAIVEANIEGSIISPPTINGSDLTLVVAGVLVSAHSNTIIRTPTKRLTLVDVANQAPFPGRADAGFVNGSAQVEGYYDTAKGVLHADKLYLEPGRQIMIGHIANPTSAGAVVNGVNVLLTSDPRIPSSPIHNKFGFSIQPTTIPDYSVSTVAGYYAGNILRAFLISVDAPEAALISNAPQISLICASVQKKLAGPAGNQTVHFHLDACGAVFPGFSPQRIELYRLDAGTPIFLGSTESHPVWNTPYGQFDLNLNDIPGEAPISVRVVNASAPGRPSAELDVGFK